MLVDEVALRRARIQPGRQRQDATPHNGTPRCQPIHPLGRIRVSLRLVFPPAPSPKGEPIAPALSPPSAGAPSPYRSESAFGRSLPRPRITKSHVRRATRQAPSTPAQPMPAALACG